jgi:hypothetical protein
VAPRSRKRGPHQLCQRLARPPADDSGDDDRVTTSACPRSSQSSHDITGVTAGGEPLRLLRLIRVLRLFGGAGAPPPPNHHEARINQANVAEAADVSAVAPSPRLVAHRPREREPRQLWPQPDCRGHDRPGIPHGPRRAHARRTRGNPRPDGQGPAGGAGSPSSLSDRARPRRTSGSKRSWKLRAERRLRGPGVKVSVKPESSAQIGPRGPVAGAGRADGGGGTGVHAAPGKAFEGSRGARTPQTPSARYCRAGGTRPRPRDRGGRGSWRTDPARGPRQLCRHPARLPADHRSHDGLVVALDRPWSAGLPSVSPSASNLIRAIAVAGTRQR